MALTGRQWMLDGIPVSDRPVARLPGFCGAAGGDGFASKPATAFGTMNTDIMSVPRQGGEVAAAIINPTGDLPGDAEEGRWHFQRSTVDARGRRYMSDQGPPVLHGRRDGRTGSTQTCMFISV